MNLKQRAIEDLNTARRHLLDIRRSVLTADLIFSWYQQWLPAFRRTQGLIGNKIEVRINIRIGGFEKVSDVELLDDLRIRIVEVLDQAMREIDSQVLVRSILEEYILKIKDQKLATLLKEFNSVKDTAPNFAAIGFRTILTLIIREKARREKPNSNLAKKTDLQLKPDIDEALKEHIFPKDEERRLTSFLRGGNKDTFDFVVHRPDPTALVSKEEINDIVGLLNTLLPSIIP